MFMDHGGLLQETVEYESFMLPEENNITFPGHVTEDSLGVSQVAIDVDSALEAVEGQQPDIFHICC